jgi:hypothetical protein
VAGIKSILDFIIFKRIPLNITIMSLLTTIGVLVIGIIDGWQLWLVALMMILPWIFIFTFEAQWCYKHFKWYTIFYMTVLMQGGHFIEHIAQIIQIYLLDYPPAHAHGIFGALDTEWIHFLWNLTLLTFNILLIKKFPKNKWLWINLIAVIWHQIEHSYIMWVYLTTGVSGDPGLLSQGGLLFGGIPFIRADVHFIYNVLETFPIAIAFILQLKTSYNDWLKKTFPMLSEEQLFQLSKDHKVIQYKEGDVIINEGDYDSALYIITEGLVKTSRMKPKGERILRIYKKGKVFGGSELTSENTYTCLTNVEVIQVAGDSASSILEEAKIRKES